MRRPVAGTMKVNRTAIAGTLAWEFFRRGWWRILNAQIAILGVSAIVYVLILRSGPIDPQAGRTLHFVLMCILFVASAGAALATLGEPERFYLLPLSNRVLAALVLVPGMLCMATIYLATAASLNRFFDVGWPLCGPAAFLAVALGAIQAASYIAGTGRVVRLAGWCLVGIPLEAWLCTRYGGGSFLSPKMMWTTVTVGEMLTLAAIGAVEFVVVEYGIARNRRGDPAVVSALHLPSIQHWRGASKPFPRFRGASQAQFWFEWRQKGLILPAIFGVFAAFMTAAYLLKNFDNGEYELLHGCFGFGSAFAPIALVAGLVMGHLDPAAANPECGSFVATRPATNAALARAGLMTEAVSLVATWGLWSAAMLGTTLLLYVIQGPEPVLDLWTDHGKFAASVARLGYWYAAFLGGIVLLVAWTPLAIASALVLTGRQRLLLTAVTAIVPVLLLCLYVAESRTDSGTVADRVRQYMLGAGALLGTIWLFAAAHRRRQIGAPVCAAAFGGWLGLCSLSGGVCLILGATDPAFLALVAGLLALPLAPLAAAPLALSWNRHR